MYNLETLEGLDHFINDIQQRDLPAENKLILVMYALAVFKLEISFELYVNEPLSASSQYAVNAESSRVIYSRGSQVIIRPPPCLVDTIDQHRYRIPKRVPVGVAPDMFSLSFTHDHIEKLGPFIRDWLTSQGGSESLIRKFFIDVPKAAFSLVRDSDGYEYLDRDNTTWYYSDYEEETDYYTGVIQLKFFSTADPAIQIAANALSYVDGLSLLLQAPLLLSAESSVFIPVRTEDTEGTGEIIVASDFNEETEDHIASAIEGIIQAEEGE